MTAPAVPASSEGLADALHDPTKLAFKDQAELETYVSQYARNVMRADKDLQGQIDEQVQAGLADFAREHELVNRPDIRPGDQAPKAKGYNSAALGAKLDNEFSDSRDFLRSIYHGARGEAAAKAAKIRNDYATQYAPDGGFLVPESFRASLLALALESSIVRSRATVVPMEAARVAFPYIDSTSHASSVFGGMIGYWTEESGALTESQAVFGRVVLEAHKLTGYSEVPNELFSDSLLAFESFLSQRWPAAIAYFEDVAFTSGSGVGQPFGWRNAGATVTVSAETGQASGTIVWENLVKMYSRLLPTSIGNAVWVVNNNVFPELATMALSVGTGGAPIWLGDGVNTPPMSILGLPVIRTEKVPTLGTAGDISLVDLSYYLVGDRQQMVMATSPHYKFANDQTVVRIIERVDGRPWLQTALTPRNGSTLSPFVNLATR